MNAVFLWGMPACGKSTVGPLLADKLNYNFYDLDEVIEKEEKASIDKIFSEKGEQYFRAAEKKYLQGLFSNKDRIVLATGGGTPCFHDNATYMNTNGISIYLDTEVNILASRLLKSKAKRPLLDQVKDLEETLVNTLNERRKNYLQASHVVHVGDEYPDVIVKMILPLLK